MTALWPDLLGGGILIACGILILRYPMLIAGYNTMPPEKRKNVDIDGLSSFMQRHLTIAGGIWILLAVVFYLTGQMGAQTIVYIVLLPVYLIWIVVRSQRYDHNK